MYRAAGHDALMTCVVGPDNLRLRSGQAKSEERALQLEQSLQAQRNLQDQVDRLSLLSGFQATDTSSFLPGKPTGVSSEREQPLMSSSKPKPGMREVQPVSSASELSSAEFAAVDLTDDVRAAEDEDAMAALHSERERVETLSDRVRALERELTDLNKKHDALIQVERGRRE